MLMRRIIPKSPEERPTIFEAAVQLEWTYLKKVSADPARMVPAEHAFRPVGTNVTVRYIDDFVTKLKYTLVEGEDPDEIEVVIEELAETIPVYTDDEILALYPNAKTPEERVQAVHRVGVAAPGRRDDRFFSVLSAAASAPEPAVRRAAIKAVPYAGWPERQDLLRNLVADPDEDVRRDAGLLLRALSGAKA
jgi:hypothetical protein